MRISPSYFVLIFSVFLFVSCSEDDASLPPVELDAISVSNAMTFLEDPVSVTIEGSGYSDIEVNSNIASRHLDINIIGDNIVEITSAKAGKGRIYIRLMNENGDLSETKSFDVEFLAHGVVDLEVVEGVTIDGSNRDRLVTLLGEPDYTLPTSDGLAELYYYFSKGLYFVVSNTNVVSAVSIRGKRVLYAFEGGEEFVMEIYPYEIMPGLTFENPQLKTDEIVSRLGNPDEKNRSSQSSLKNWHYRQHDLYMFFYSDSENNYSGKDVEQIYLY